MPKDLESLQKSRERRQEVINKYGEVPCSIWNIDFSAGKDIIEYEERKQHVKAVEKHKDMKYDKRLYENFSASSQNVRGKNGGLSTFPPDLAKRIVLFYSNKGDTILDLCAGHNSRMQVTNKLDRHYIGYDPAKLFMAFNREVETKIKNELFYNGYNITLKEKSSEKLDEEDNSMDMIYTSPPYYCLTPDTKLYTTTGLKQIKDIQIGDLVYTHTGKWRKVTKLINHDINENIMLLKFYGCSEPLKITKNHKIWILKAKRCSYCNCICVPECGYLRSQSKEWKFKKCYHEYKNYKPEFLPVGKITDSDYICFPRDKRIKDVLSIKISDFVDKNLIKKEIVDDKLFFSANQFGKRVLNNTIYLTNDFWKLAGYFIAEGCTTNRSEINFTFNENEIEYLQEVTKLFESVFGIGLRERKGVSVIHLVTYNRVLQSFFSTFFGKYAHGKKLPNFFFHLPYEKQSNFLKGYINGDGCCINTKNERRYSMVTVSPVLAGQLRYLFHRLGVANKISYNDKTVGLPSTSKLGIIKKHGSYSISIAGQSSHILDDIYGIPYRKQQKKSRDFSSWITDEFIGYLVIKKGIQEIPYSGKVYNLEVEIDNSYTLLQGNVHNCVEDYGNEPEQLAKGRTYEEFLLALKSCISEGYRVLKPEKYCIFNINDFRMDGIFYPYHADVAKLFQEVGFKLWDIIIINWRTAIGASFASQIEDRKICAKMHEYLVVGRK